MGAVITQLGRWLGIIVIVILVMAGFYFLNAFQAQRVQTTTAYPPPSTQQPTSKQTFTSTSSLSPSSLPLMAQASPNLTVSMATWQTFTNPTYGYSLKYPPDWTAQVFFDNSPKSRGRQLYISQQGIEIYSQKGRALGLVYIEVFLNASDMSLVEWLRDNGPGLYDKSRTVNGIPIPDQPNYDVAGKPAIRMVEPAGQSPAIIRLYVPNSMYVYKISLFLDTPDLLDQVYSPMVSSLRFTN